MSDITIGGLTIYKIVWFFMIYSFLGWVLEVVYHAVSNGEIVNRGFLNGPVCPIYGFGMVGVFTLFNSLASGGITEVNAGLLFLLGLTLATAIELFGGWALNTIFHARWWDYSSEPFNFHGYICPKFSLYWGFIIVFAVRIFHPFVASSTVDLWPEKIGWPVAVVLSTVYMADVVTTVLIVNGFNRELANLDEVQTSMRRVSDQLTELLAAGSIRTVQHVQENRVRMELAGSEFRDKATDLQDKYEKKVVELQERSETLAKKQQALLSRITKNGLFGPKRLIKAFPEMEMLSHKEAFELLKKKLRG